MEVLKEGKNFRLVADNELESVVEVLEQHLPHSIKFHQTIRTYLRDKVWQFYFYVAKDWPEVTVCLHFPGCTLTPNNHLYESIGVFCPLDQLEHLNLLNSEDVLIDWGKPLYINFAQSEVLAKIADFYESNVGEVDKLDAEVFAYEPSQFIKPEIFEKVPDEETELRLLSAANVKDIHDLYPAGDIESIEVFERLIERLPGCGIFIRSTGELVAWMVQSYYGAMFSMQTKPDHRRKGYGLWLAGTLTNFVIKRGYLPFVVIRPDNSASKGLYTKLGFEKKLNVVRAIFKPSLHHTIGDKEA